MAVTYNLPLTHFWQPAGLAPITAALPGLVQVAPDLAVDPAQIAALRLEDMSLQPDQGWWALHIHLRGSTWVTAHFGGPDQPPGTAEAHAWYQRLIEAHNDAERREMARPLRRDP